MPRILQTSPPMSAKSAHKESHLLYGHEDDEIIDRVLAGVDPVPKAILRGLSKMPGGWDAIAQAVRLCYAELEKIENEGGRKAD